jgi:hypothetical protein
MTPRVFVSSTYYDLKHVRERIEKFIESYGFEPVLFESDKVTYQHGKPIDYSAYNEVNLCHIMILIIGGRYGSASTMQDADVSRSKYDEDFVSITRKEFETAKRSNIPTFIFIDKNVYAEFQTYKENVDFFDEQSSSKKPNELNFRFAHVDHINIFKFIESVKSKSIKTFEKVEEIENYIKSQLSGMFYLYLESLKRNSEDNKILDTVAELNNISVRMNTMLTSVGKRILGNDNDDYKRVIEQQFEILINFFGEQFKDCIGFRYVYDNIELDSIDLDSVASLIYDLTLKQEIPHPVKKMNPSESYFIRLQTQEMILLELQQKLTEINPNLLIESYVFLQLNFDFHKKVYPFIDNPEKENQLIQVLKSELTTILLDLPF